MQQPQEQQQSSPQQPSPLAPQEAALAVEVGEACLRYLYENYECNGFDTPLCAGHAALACSSLVAAVKHQPEHRAHAAQALYLLGLWNLWVHCNPGCSSRGGEKAVYGKHSARYLEACMQQLGEEGFESIADRGDALRPTVAARLAWAEKRLFQLLGRQRQQRAGGERVLPTTTTAKNVWEIEEGGGAGGALHSWLAELHESPP